jgi:hypothetical protein
VTATREELRRACERHLTCWNALDREGWIALFDPDVRFDDPVGVPTKHGLQVRGDSDPPEAVDAYFQMPSRDL